MKRPVCHSLRWEWRVRKAGDFWCCCGSLKSGAERISHWLGQEIGETRRQCAGESVPVEVQGVDCCLMSQNPREETCLQRSGQVECSYQQAELSPMVWSMPVLNWVLCIYWVAALLLTVGLGLSMYKATSVLLNHGLGDFCITWSFVERERSYFAVRCCVTFPG